MISPKFQNNLSFWSAISPRILHVTFNKFKVNFDNINLPTTISKNNRNNIIHDIFKFQDTNNYYSSSNPHNNRHKGFFTQQHYKKLCNHLRKSKEKNNITLHIVVCYAPTNPSPTTQKNKFYNKLQILINTIPSHHHLVILGDFNALIGTRNWFNNDVVGPHSFGPTDSTYSDPNSDRLINFAQNNNLIISNTWFKHKLIHKFTYIDPKSNYVKKKAIKEHKKFKFYNYYKTIDFVLTKHKHKNSYC